MARPGFVLEVDDRTPPLLVPEGDGFRLERFPLGTRVVYPPEPLQPLVDVAQAIEEALDAPLDAGPLSTRLRPGMKLTIAFDDNTVPQPRMPEPDLRGRIIEAVLTRAAAAGVDDVALVCATGLNRRMTSAELQRLLGERVFRSFFADGLLTNHDAEDKANLTTLAGAEGDAEALSINARAAGSDLLVFVHLAGSPRGGGAEAVLLGLGSASTIGLLSGLNALGEVGARLEMARQLAESVPIFAVQAVLDNAAFPPPVEFLGHREWEWSIRDQATWLGIRPGLALVPTKARRRLLSKVSASYAPIQVTAGALAAVRDASAAKVLAQQVVEVDGQSDVGIVGVGHGTPYSVDAATNPILAAWQGVASTFTAHTGRPVVREGGALILYHPLPVTFSTLHHPSYVDFFAEVLTATTDPAQLQEEFEVKFADDPWYVHLYRTSYAFHGVHPFYLWYEMAAAQAHCGDIVWVGADRRSAARMGFRAASTLADALEIVSSTVGPTPTITYLHGPPQLVADVR